MTWGFTFPVCEQRRARGPPPPDHLLPSCGMNQACAPAGVRVERVLLLEGPREVEVIQECQCEVRLSQCMRVPALKTYHAETPHEAVLDVGGCSLSKGSPGEVQVLEQQSAPPPPPPHPPSRLPPQRVSPASPPGLTPPCWRLLTRWSWSGPWWTVI